MQTASYFLHNNEAQKHLQFMRFQHQNKIPPTEKLLITFIDESLFSYFSILT